MDFTSETKTVAQVDSRRALTLARTQERIVDTEVRIARLEKTLHTHRSRHGTLHVEAMLVGFKGELVGLMDRVRILQNPAAQI
jgi:hypothetical protein